jgi:hypothetical protein
VLLRDFGYHNLNGQWCSWSASIADSLDATIAKDDT